jgi:RimJ/RimL family protein N-acetyltransferase
MNHPATFIHKGKTILKEEGVKELLHRIQARLWRRHRIALLEYELNAPPRMLHARIPVEFRWATQAELELLFVPELDFNDVIAQEAHRWLRRGDLCLIGYVDELPATYLWMTFSLRELPAYRWPVGLRRAYFYKTFTRAALRRNGLNQAALSFALAHCYDLGLQRVFIDVDVSNVSSLGAIRKVGFKDIGVFHIFHIGSRRFSYVPRAVAVAVAGS